MWIASSAALVGAGKLLRSPRMANEGFSFGFSFVLMAGLLSMLMAYAIDLYGHSQTGLRPEQHVYGAVVYAVLAWQGLHICIVCIMISYTLARAWRGMLDVTRRITFDNTRLFWHYTAGQGIAAILLLHAASRWLA